MRQIVETAFHDAAGNRQHRGLLLAARDAAPVAAVMLTARLVHSPESARLARAAIAEFIGQRVR